MIASMTEAWMEGPVPGVDPLLQPAAHAFVQAQRDVRRLLEGLAAAQIWTRPGASASIGFHAVHLAGATDRLLTYARGALLTAEQKAAAGAEGKADVLTAEALVAIVDAAVAQALTQLRATPAATLTEVRGVGRQQLPSTVIGLLFHAAEHATRHAGQMATLRQIVAGA
jgi:uncharacterized damage-inducible protein DinB